MHDNLVQCLLCQRNASRDHYNFEQTIKQSKIQMRIFQIGKTVIKIIQYYITLYTKELNQLGTS